MKPAKSPRKTAKKTSPVKAPDLEEALRQSEASYHGLFNTIRQAIYIHDHEGRFVDVNDGACAMYGYTREEFIGRTPEFLAAPGLNDFNYVMEQFQKAFEGEPQQLEFWGRRRNGEIFPKDVRLYKGKYFGNNVLIGVATDITGQKQAEKALLESESFNRGLVENMPDYIAVYGMDGLLLYVNPASARGLGYDADLLVGTPVLSYVAEEFCDTVKAKMAARRKGGDTSPYEIDMVTKTGLRRSVIVKATPIQYKNNPAILLLLIDITERRKAEKALAESEELFREVFNNANDAVFLHELTPQGPGKYLLVNDIALCWLGYTRDELMNMSPQDIVPEEVGQKIFPAISKVLAKSGHATFESLHRRKNGSTYPVEVSTHTFVLGKRKVGLSIDRDITWRKQKQDELQKSEGRYRTLLGAVTDCVLSVRVENGIAAETTHGPGCEAVTGYTPEEFSTDPGLWLRMVVDDDRAAVAGQLEQIFTGDKVQPIEYRIVHKDGRVLWVRNTPVPRYDAAGNLTAYDGLIHDITAKKQVEQAFLKSEAQLNAIIQASPISMFVINNSHQVISWNKALENTTGIGAQTILGTNRHWKAFYPEERPCLADLLVDGLHEKIPVLYAGKWKKSAVAEGAIEATDFFPHMGAGGKWLHFIAAPIIDSSGTLIGATETLEDITGLVQAQQELRESESRYSALFTNNHSVSLLIDPDTGRIVDANESAVQYYGYSRDQLTMMGIYDLNRLPKDNVVRNLQRAKDEKEKHFLSAHYRMDGEKRYVEVYSGPIRVQGKPLFYSIIHDITDRKLAETALQVVQEKYMKAFLLAPDAITVSELASGRFLEVNDAATKIYGYSREELIGKSASELGIWLGKKDRDAFIEQVRTRGRVAQYEIVERRKSGELINVSVTADTMIIGDIICLITVIRDITERKMVEQALKESESRYNALFTNNNSVSLLIDPDTGMIVDVNEAAVRYYGYSYDEMIAMGIYDLNRLPKENVIRNLRRAKDEKEKHFFSTHYRVNGEKRNVEVYSGPIRVQGKPLFYSIIHDITDRKQAEIALQKSQYLLSEAMDMAHMADWEFDVPTGIFTFNDRFYSLYGTTAEREGGYQMPAEVYAREFVHPDEADLVAAEVGRAITTTDPNYRALLEHRIIRRDGEVRHIVVRLRITKDAEGRTIKTHGANQDITDRKLAEQGLRESEERYRTLIDQLPDYVIVHRDGILLYVNPAAASQLGYTLEMLVGKPLLPFIAPEYHDTVREAIALRMTGAEIPAYEMKIKAKDGTYRVVLANGAKVNFEGRPASLNVLSDITAIKLAEETIWRANAELEKRVLERTEALSQANKQLTAEIEARNKAELEISRSLEEKDLLLREIHHRVKNNLQIIASLLKLQSRTITDPNVLEAIKNSQSRIRAMALVHERIYRSHNIAEINLGDYLNYLTKQIFQFYNIQQHQIGITVTMDEIHADIDTITPLGLIINELVSNSLKYAFPEGRKGAISIGCTLQDAGMLRIVYHDNGTGMPAGFDWKNAESLGLRLVNSLVDQLNGTIESGTGEGTTFIITIQQKRESSAT